MDDFYFFIKYPKKAKHATSHNVYVYEHKPGSFQNRIQREKQKCCLFLETGYLPGYIYKRALHVSLL